MSGPARRILAAVTAVLPAGRRVWGQALLAELDHVQSRRDRAWLLLAAARVALLPPPAAAGYGKAAGRAVLTAVIAWIPLAAAIYLSRVVYPGLQDSTLGDAAAQVYVIIALMAAGAAAHRASARTGAPAVVGLLAGLVLAILVLATAAVVDNAFLAVISRQPARISGLHASGMTSMRGYVNANLESLAPGLCLLMAAAGAILGALGATAAHDFTSRDTATRPSPPSPMTGRR
jgi:hypothetical protein